jgi:CheY-like chemotaxis protein
LLDTNLTDEQRSFAEIVRISGESLLALINGILDFSKIEAGKLDLEILEFDLHSLLLELSAMTAAQAEKKQLKFSSTAAPDVPSQLRGDPVRLRQVLINLVGNALKFTSQGKVAVSVCVDNETERDIVLRFAIRDTGIGIAADKLDLLFNKFTQVDTSTTRRYGGTGLGLAISKQLAELMGGQIGVKSEAGRGSEFWFTSRFVKLPQPGAAKHTLNDVDAPGVDQILTNPVATAEQPNHQVLRNVHGSSIRVLVVEDNMTNQQVALGILSKLGIRAEAVANGREALEALRCTPFDLVFMDVQMPVMDGLDATRAAHAPDAAILNRSIPIIAMTAHVMPEDREKCLAAGMNDYIAKPVNPMELSRMLDKWIK